MTDDVELHGGGCDDGDEDVRVVVAPAAGGRVRRIVVSGVDLLAEPANGDPTSTGWGSFPMAPWVGRIRNGRFSYLGRDVALDLNHQDGDGAGGGPLNPARPATQGELPAEDRDRHSIHGTTFSRVWSVDDHTTTALAMSCELTGALGWPFPGTARQTISVSPGGVDFEMRVEAADATSFPASLGWHPWFAKPDRLDFTPTAMYEQDDAGLPTGRLVAVPPGPWDDCFVNHGPVRMIYDRSIVSTVTVTSPTDHWVVFDRPGHATCVEPQTGPPDAPTLRPHLVAPGAPLRHTMRIAWA